MRCTGGMPRLWAVLFLACAVIGLGLHLHESGSPESHCAICHFAIGFTALVQPVPGIILPQVASWALPDSPEDGHRNFALVVCGRRAPPTLL